MISLRKVAAVGVVLVAALTLQGCKKKTAQQPPYQPAYTPPPAHGSHPVVARMAVDGHPCEHTWRATWRDGGRSICRTFCCYHRNRVTHRRTRHSYCRVHEQGHEVLKMCAPRGALLPFSAAELMEEEADEAEEGVSSAAERLGALPLFACSAGFVFGGVSVFLALRPRLRSGAGSDEQKAPFIES